MKIWFGYGSEHSMKLVMIGRFQEVGDATKAMEVIERLTAQVNTDVEARRLQIGEITDRYSDEMLKLLRDLPLLSLGPGELEQFAYEVAIEADDDHIVVKTDEADVSAFLKVLINTGARVEVYSAHQ